MIHKQNKKRFYPSICLMEIKKMFKLLTANRILKGLKYICVFYLIYFSIFLFYLKYAFDEEIRAFDEIETEESDQIFLNKSIHLKKKLSNSRKYYSPPSIHYEQDCHLQSEDCFDFYQCQHNSSHLKVFIYPQFTANGKYSKQFQEYIHTIYESEYYEPDPTKACLFIPPVDLLNEDFIDKKLVTEKLHNLTL